MSYKEKKVIEFVPIILWKNDKGLYNLIKRSNSFFIMFKVFLNSFFSNLFYRMVSNE